MFASSIISPKHLITVSRLHTVSCILRPHCYPATCRDSAVLLSTPYTRSISNSPTAHTPKPLTGHPPKSPSLIPSIQFSARLVQVSHMFWPHKSLPRCPTFSAIRPMKSFQRPFPTRITCQGLLRSSFFLKPAEPFDPILPHGSGMNPLM